MTTAKTMDRFSRIAASPRAMAVAGLLFCAVNGLAQIPPPLSGAPTNPPLDTWSFTDNTNRTSDRGYAPLSTYRIGTNDTPFLFNGRYGVQSDPNGLLYMQARYYNPYLCRFVNPDPSGFGGGLNFYAYANGNPVTYLDPFGLGAVLDNAIAASSRFNAPTPAETQVENFLAGFVNLATLGVANLVSSATTGKDLAGDNLNVTDAFEQTLQAGAFAATLPLDVLTEGESLEAEGVLETGLADGSATAEGEGLSAGSIRNVNPTGNSVNCVNCAIASEYTLRGFPASAVPTSGPLPISSIMNEFGGNFTPVSGPMEIGSILSQSGNGASGVVFGRGVGMNHVWNAVNQAGNIRFLDGQIGGLGVQNFEHFSDFQFLLTTPGR